MKTVDEKLATLFHEAGHALMHRGMNYDEIHRSKGEIEAEAECFSYLCCRSIGINQNSQIYIKSWLDQSPEYLKGMVPELTGHFHDFAKKVQLKENAHDFAYRVDYPVHYCIYKNMSLEQFNFSKSDLEKEDSRGYTPAMVAITTDNNEALNHLEEKSINLDYKNTYGVSVDTLKSKKSKHLSSPLIEV